MGNRLWGESDGERERLGARGLLGSQHTGWKEGRGDVLRSEGFVKTGVWG